MSELKKFEKEAESIADEAARDYRGKGTGSNPKSHKAGLKNVQVPQPDGSSKPMAATEGGLSIKHGVYTFMSTGLLPCDRCILRNECDQFREGETCSIIETFRQGKTKQIMALDHIREEDRDMAIMLVNELTIQMIILKYISRAGIFRPGHGSASVPLKFQPVMTEHSKAVAKAVELCNSLGLSPISRAKLGIKEESKDMVELLAEEAENDK